MIFCSVDLARLLFHNTYRLVPGLSEEEAADYFEELIGDALLSVRTQVNYFMHLIRHG